MTFRSANPDARPILYRSAADRIAHRAAVAVNPDSLADLTLWAQQVNTKADAALLDARAQRGEADFQTALSSDAISTEIRSLFADVSADLVEVHGLLSTIERTRSKIERFVSDAAVLQRELDDAVEAEFGFRISLLSRHMAAIPEGAWSRWREWRDPSTVLPEHLWSGVESAIAVEIQPQHAPHPAAGTGGRLFAFYEISRQLQAAPMHEGHPLGLLDAAASTRERAAEILREVRGDLRVHQEWVLSNLRAEEADDRADEAERQADADSRRTRFEGSVAVVAAVFVPAGVVAGIYGANVWTPATASKPGDVTAAGMLLTILSVSLLGGAFARWIAPVPGAASDQRRDLAFSGTGLIGTSLLSAYLWVVCSLRPEGLDALSPDPLHRVEALIAAVAATVAAGHFGARLVRVDRASAKGPRPRAGNPPG